MTRSAKLAMRAFKLLAVGGAVVWTLLNWDSITANWDNITDNWSD